MLPYTLIENLETAVPIPENGILSKAVFADDHVKAVAFAFSQGQELSAHTAPMAAILYFVKGDAELALGDQKQTVHAGAFIHMAPGTPHGIFATTPVVMLLLMLKQARA